MKAKLLKSIYAVRGTKQIIDIFPTLKDLHNCMKARGYNDYEVLYYYELATKVDELGFIPMDADILATGKGPTMLEAKKDLLRNLKKEYSKEEVNKYLKLFKI